MPRSSWKHIALATAALAIVLMLWKLLGFVPENAASAPAPSPTSQRAESASSATPALGESTESAGRISRSSSAETPNTVLDTAAEGPTLRADRFGLLRGRVIDPDGQPAVGAEVWIGSQLANDPAPEQHLRSAAITDALGQFEAPFERSDEYASARLIGYGTSRSHPLHQLGDGEVVLVLGRESCALIGTLVDELQQPIANAIVSIEALEHGLHRDEEGQILGPRLGAVTRSDEMGHFEFQGLAPGSHHLRANRLPNHTLDAVVALEAGHVDNLRYIMPRRALVRGHVRRSNGAPCQRVLVALRYEDRLADTEISDSAGAFSFHAVEFRPFELIATRASSQHKAKRNCPAPTVEPIDIDLVFDEPPQIYGSVHGANGLPLSHWFITVGIGDAAVETPTDAEGRFRVGDRAPGVHALCVHRRSKAVDQAVLRTVADTDVEAHLEVPIDALPFAEIVGHVVGKNGLPLTGARIDLPYAGSANQAEPGTAALRFIYLWPGDHWLRISAPGYVSWLQAIALQENERKDLGAIQLTAEARLRVRFLKPDGSVWRIRPPTPWLSRGPGQFLMVPSDVQYSIDGDEVLASGLAAGTYQLHSAVNDELLIDPTEVTLIADQEERITMRTHLGRKRVLVFEGLEGLSETDEQLHITVRHFARNFVVESQVRVDGKQARCAVVVPLGENTVEARIGARRIAMHPFEVSAASDDAFEILVPLLP